ncbi:FAD-binding oxidoreductase [Ruegeria lacuscaerulensis]|uniref:FAD-binding oxidoreductase n=1 Tax=Ruegeria lacuscaerulensis TaxID=55218 RepID=UPI00147B7746|nr:FAD-binding protein [Ruegeria lacuscaerulensis]
MEGSVYFVEAEAKLTERELLEEHALLEGMRAQKIEVALAANLPPLPTIPDAELLLPGTPDYIKFLPLHNIRNDLAPALRIMCKTPQAVATSINWITQHELPFALRSGGHCYEGFSQSSGVVIDLRPMSSITVDPVNEIVTVGAGADLGAVYRKVSAAGFAFAAGSCPTVGVAGHTLGGGQGLLGRCYGLASDNITRIELVNAEGRILSATDQTETDHYWAARGGGGGSFGAATEFEFQIHRLSYVHTFAVTWALPDTSASRDIARDVFDAWQNWSPSAPNEIMALMKVEKISSGELRLRCFGQTVGSEQQLRDELNNNVIVHPAPGTGALTTRRRTFFDAVKFYAGNNFDYDPVFMEAKSDVFEKPLSRPGMDVLFDEIMSIPSGHVVAICDPLGGAIADLAQTETPFPYRGENSWAVQYFSQWRQSRETALRVAQNDKVYAALRPFATGTAYVNYPDISLPDYAASYWGANLQRLKSIKRALDPNDVFQHQQSVPIN